MRKIPFDRLRDPVLEIPDGFPAQDGPCAGDVCVCSGDICRMCGMPIDPRSFAELFRNRFDELIHGVCVVAAKIEDRVSDRFQRTNDAGRNVAAVGKITGLRAVSV